jgi:hypothetical protein
MVYLLKPNVEVTGAAALSVPHLTNMGMKDLRHLASNRDCMLGGTGKTFISKAWPIVDEVCPSEPRKFVPLITKMSNDHAFKRDCFVV